MNDDVRKRGAEQLNKPSAQPEQTSFSLEEVMREYGGWTRAEETAEVPVMSKMDQAPEQVEPTAEAQKSVSGMEELVLESDQEIASEPAEPKEEPRQSRQSRFQFIRMDLGETQGETTDPLELAWERLSAPREEADYQPAQQGSDPEVELKVLPQTGKARRGREVNQSTAPRISNRDAFQKAKKQQRRDRKSVV